MHWEIKPYYVARTVEDSPATKKNFDVSSEGTSVWNERPSLNTYVEDIFSVFRWLNLLYLLKGFVDGNF
jgi:hypothetical protein